MKRTLLIAAFAMGCFMLGSLFTIGVGNYLADMSAPSPAVLSPSSFGRSI